MLLYCHAGCEIGDVVAALGLTMADLFADEYRYQEADGRVSRTVFRGYQAGDAKRFRQKVASGASSILYRLPEVIDAVSDGQTIYLVEGEKDVKALESLGVIGTTAPMGASNFAKVDVSPLTGAPVVVVVDRDAAGDHWASDVNDRLAGVASSVAFVRAKAGKDAADHVAAGYGVGEFEPYVAAPVTAQDARTTRGEGAEPSHKGQVRMAYRLADAYADRLMHVHGLGWFVWEHCRWAEDTHGRAQRAVLDVLRQALMESFDDSMRDLRDDVRRCETAAGVAGVLTLAASLEEFAFTVNDLDADPYLLNCSNGTLNLRTLELRRHNPADRLTKVTGAAFDAQAQGPTWEAFLARVLPDESVRGFLQGYVGLSLAGRVLEHRLAILTGTGRNGKGVFAGAVSCAMGDYAITAEPDLFMHREGAHPTGEMDLLGVRFIVVSESDRDRRLAEATVKRLTGGDLVRARKMRQDYVQFRPSHTAVLVTNHLPKVSGDDPALWARLRVVPFGVVIPEPEQDPHLPERLDAEAEAVLAWAVAGWQAYQEKGMTDPDAVKVATDRYRFDSDSVGRFLADCTISNPHGRIAAGALYERYSRWAADDGAEVLSKKPFGQELERRGFSDTRTGSGRYRKGLLLRADEDEDDA